MNVLLTVKNKKWGGTVSETARSGRDLPKAAYFPI